LPLIGLQKIVKPFVSVLPARSDNARYLIAEIAIEQSLSTSPAASLISFGRNFFHALRDAQRKIPVVRNRYSQLLEAHAKCCRRGRRFGKAVRRIRVWRSAYSSGRYEQAIILPNV
jgi:hypothetical protein